MEFASRMRWTAMIVLSVVAFLLIGWGLISITRNLFNVNDSVRDELRQEEEQAEKYNVAEATQAQILVSGAIVSETEHSSYEITVNSNVVSIKVFRGYDRDVIDSKSYRNTQNAYDAFIAALEKMNVTSLREGAQEDDDEQGVCPSGRRYVLTVDDLRRWSGSCSRRVGTAGFSMSQVVDLFEEQIPRDDFRELRRSIDL